MELSPGAREKRLRFPTHTMRVLEFDAGFEEPDWCRNPHFGFVVSGEISIEFRDSIMRYREGDGVCIAAGEESEHRVVVSESVMLFLVEPHKLEQ